MSNAIAMKNQNSLLLPECVFIDIDCHLHLN